jgi:hypothetical protein
MKKNIVLCMMLFSALFVFSQNDVLENKANLQNLKETNLHISGVWIPGKPLENIVNGSVYLFPNWIGQYTVIDKNGVSNKLYNLNYNIKNNALESAISKDSVFQYDIDKIDYVLNANNKFKFFDDETMKGLFLEVVSSDKIKVYKGYKIFIEEGSFNPLTQEKMQNDSYKQSFSFYFFTNGKYEKVKLNKSTVLNYLKDKKDFVKDYVTKYDMSFTNDNDIKSIFNYYLTLN